MSTLPLTGEFGEIGLAEVFQLCAQVRSSGTLILISPKSAGPVGAFAFEGGELVDARFEELVGIDAVRRALKSNEGHYRFDSGMRVQQRRIFTPLSVILLNATLPENDQTQVAHTLDTKRQLPVVSVVPSPDDDSETDVSSAPAALAALQLERPSGTRSAGSPGTDSVPEGKKGRRLIAALGLVAVAGGASALLLRGGTPPRPPSTETAPASPAARTQPAAAPTSPAPTAAAPTGVQGVTKDEVVFGMVAPFSGPSRELGRQMKLGVDAAFAEANAAGGVHGRRLRLLTADDGYEPTRTGPAMTELRDTARVFGFVGNVGTPTSMVALPLALERKMLFYGAFTGASLLRRDPPDRYVVNFRASYGEETAAVVKYLVKVRHIRPEHIVVFAQSDAFGDAGYAGVVKTLRSLRPDLKAPVRLGYQRNTVDVGEALARLHEHGLPVKAVVMVATYRAAARFIEKTRDLYPNMIFTNVSFVGSTSLASELLLLGPHYAKGVIVTQVVPPIASMSTAVLAYKRALAASAQGEEPDYVSEEGYWSGRVLVEALKEAGPKLDSDTLVDAFERLHGLDFGLGTTIGFGLSEHQGSHKVWGTQLDESGHYQPVDLE
jgi:ABC-type branched-subunit amino acid transport system substrate-binding protein